MGHHDDVDYMMRFRSVKKSRIYDVHEKKLDFVVFQKVLESTNNDRDMFNVTSNHIYLDKKQQDETPLEIWIFDQEMSSYRQKYHCEEKSWM